MDVEPSEVGVRSFAAVGCELQVEVGASWLEAEPLDVSHLADGNQDAMSCLAVGSRPAKDSAEAFEVSLPDDFAREDSGQDESLGFFPCAMDSFPKNNLGTSFQVSHDR